MCEWRHHHKRRKHRRHHHHHRHHHHMRRVFRRVRRLSVGAEAIVNNAPRMGANSGLINIPIQIPINLGDATANNRSHGNSTTNTL
ncbi:hypothetical protein [Hazenella coriacea]|uniref:Uncharacterized protein n=1 Tax=Hazenella coriacea TaxID=1179467 RepID=A0A4R3L0T3_9BACL|nr:hypothetical protein [Hazenella coriacea]TCS93153.1 hypothetical protein EDD58_10995 [Hazenella coriacea]